jgi:hypothetical protein
MPTFYVTVEEAGSAPTVNIVTPANGATYKVNQPLTASVEILSDLPLTSVDATLNGDPVTLALNSETGDWEANLVLSQPGANVFQAVATNGVGEGSATSNFTVTYDWAGWLPPITTAKFQRGRTLPVKFRVNDYNGPTADAVAGVYLDNVLQGLAGVQYDANGQPYYQLEIKLDVVPGPHAIGVLLDDGVTGQSMIIQVK